MNALATYLTVANVPDGTPTMPPGPIGDFIKTLISLVQWGVIAAAVVALCVTVFKVAAVRFGWTSGVGSAIAEIPYPLLGVVLALGVSALVTLVA